MQHGKFALSTKVPRAESSTGAALKCARARTRPLVSALRPDFPRPDLGQMLQIEYSWVRMKPSPFVIAIVAVACIATATAQTSASASVSSAASPAVSPATSSGPVSYASMTEVNAVLSELTQASQTLNGDLGKLRVEKWKTDGETKRQSLTNVESIQRNLQTALPVMVSQLNAAPDSLSQTFKVYRNVGALYDVLANLAESAGAFGSKDEYQSLTNDASSVEKARRDLAERMDKLAAAKDSELVSLHTQVQALQAAMPPEPPKKIIIDDTEKPKKPPVKKKVAKPAAPGAAKPAAPAAPKVQ